MHIDRCLKSILLAAVKKPVDRALLICFQVVGVEIIQEVATDHLARRALTAERIGNKEAGFALGLSNSIFLENQSFHINYLSNSSVNTLLIRSQVSRKLVAS